MYNLLLAIYFIYGFHAGVVLCFLLLLLLLFINEWYGQISRNSDKIFLFVAFIWCLQVQKLKGLGLLSFHASLAYGSNLLLTTVNREAGLLSGGVEWYTRARDEFLF